MTGAITPTVAAVGQINITGHVIPLRWFQCLRHNGKPHTNAIMILADLVYWHRPREILDESTGQIIGYERKFSADKLQRSYSYYENLYGMTRKQVRSAFAFLRDEGVLHWELRDIVTPGGVHLSNQMYVDLDAVILYEITVDPELRNPTPMPSRAPLCPPGHTPMPSRADVYKDNNYREIDPPPPPTPPTGNNGHGTGNNGEYLPGLSMPRQSRHRRLSDDLPRQIQDAGLKPKQFRELVDHLLDRYGLLEAANIDTPDGNRILDRFQSSVLTLAKMGYRTTEHLDDIFVDWHRNDFRGQSGDLPNRDQLIEHAGKMLRREEGDNNGNGNKRDRKQRGNRRTNGAGRDNAWMGEIDWSLFDVVPGNSAESPGGGQ